MVLFLAPKKGKLFITITREINLKKCRSDTTTLLRSVTNTCFGVNRVRRARNEDADYDDSGDYLTDTSFQLRSLTEPPVLGEEDGTLVGEARAKKMQLMLDEQVQRLLSSERMVKFLRHQISDPLQCRRAHRTHVRRLLEILLNRLQIDCRINSRAYGKKDVVVFQLIDGQRRVLPDASGDLSSQLSYQPAMTTVKK